MRKQLRLILHMGAVFLAGAALGTVAESQFNAWRLAYYPECKVGLSSAGPGLSEFMCFDGWCPWWAPLLFGVGGLAIALGNHINDIYLWPRLRWSPPVTVAKQALVGGALFFVAWLGVSRPELGGTLGRSAWLAAFLAVTWATVGERSKITAFEALQTGVFGLLFEAFLGRGGLYVYRPGFDQALGVPPWLPLLYAIAGIAVGAVMRLTPPPRRAV
jgi:hypothetical protein